MESKTEVDSDESNKGVKRSHDEISREEAIPGQSSAGAEQEKKDESKVGSKIYVSSVKQNNLGTLALLSYFPTLCLQAPKM